MSKTKIEYVDLTINPMVGCSKCSPGCDNCYAERMAARLSKNPLTAAKYAGVVDANGKWTGQINFDLSCFDKLPKKPQRIFIGSMTDIFHENVPYDVLMSVFSSLLYHAEHTRHTFILLTKRSARMREFITDLRPSKTFRNIVLSVTAEYQQRADERIPDLLAIPGNWTRAVSIEPMLGAIDLNKLELICHTWRRGLTIGTYLDWVICGAETGPGARPMHPDWVRSLRDQCHSAEVPFFFKGMIENGKKTRLLDGREWNEVPQ